MRSLAALFVCAALVGPVAAQAPTVMREQKPSARIRGRVVAAVTGRPLLLATVTLSGGNPNARRTVQTDSNGGYEFANLPPGRYSFAASRTGYLEQNFDQPGPFARYRLLELADGELLDGMDFRLHRGAVITGVITDEAGDPLPDVSVQVMRELFGPSGRMLSAEMRTQVPIRTDDEGRYRVYALRPGMYVVKANRDPSDDPLSFGRTYYPGTINESEAQMVRVDFGLDAVANFSMIPARRVRVSGAVRDSEGRPASGMRMTLGESNGPRFDQVGMQMVSADGNFTFEHLLPGRYLIHVRPSAAQRQTMPAQVEWGATHVNVSGEDISDLVLTTSHGFAIAGRATVDGSAAPPAAKVTVGAREMDFAPQSLGFPPTIANSPVDAAGRFRIVGVRGRVRVTGGGAGWYTKKVLVRGVDVTDSGFDVSADLDGVEVVLTNQVTTVTGSVRDARGIGRNDFIVTFFPVGQFEGAARAARQRTIRPDPDGVYRIRNLPPGDYLAAAVPVMSLPIDGEWDPSFVEKVRPAAIGFKLAEGQSLPLNLTLIE